MHEHETDEVVGTNSDMEERKKRVSDTLCATEECTDYCCKFRGGAMCLAESGILSAFAYIQEMWIENTMIPLMLPITDLYIGEPPQNDKSSSTCFELP